MVNGRIERKRERAGDGSGVGRCHVVLRTEVKVARTWAVSFGEKDRMDLERIMMDEDPDSALRFVSEVIYPKVKEAEKPGACFHDVDKPVSDLKRPVSRHKKLGDFN
jgi:hypothetical protein